MKCPFLEEVDPSEDGNYAIRMASINGHTEVVRLLLQDRRVDPSDDNNKSIKWASRNGHTDIVKLLLQDERVKDTLSKEEIEKYRNIKIWYI